MLWELLWQVEVEKSPGSRAEPGLLTVYAL